jgi:hypothetical protein
MKNVNSFDLSRVLNAPALELKGGKYHSLTLQNYNTFKRWDTHAPVALEILLAACSQFSYWCYFTVFLKNTTIPST